MQSDRHIPTPSSCFHYYPQSNPLTSVDSSRHQESFQEVMDQLKATLSFPYSQTDDTTESLDDLSILEFIELTASSPYNVPHEMPTCSSTDLSPNEIRDDTGLPDPQKMMGYVNMVYDRYQHQHQQHDLKDIIWRSDEATRKSVMANNAPLDLSVGNLSRQKSTSRSNNVKKSQRKAPNRRFQASDQRSTSARKIRAENHAYETIRKRRRGPPNVTVSSYQDTFNLKPPSAFNHMMMVQPNVKSKQHDVHHNHHHHSLACYANPNMNDVSQQQRFPPMMPVHPSTAVNQADLLAHYAHWTQHYMPQLFVSQNSHQIPAGYQSHGYFSLPHPVELSVSK